MSKKVGIAVTAVVVALVVAVFFPRMLEYVIHRVQQAHDNYEEAMVRAQTEAEDKVPLEKQIERLQKELAALGQDDDQHFHKVALQRVEVTKADKEVEALRATMATRENRIRTMVSALESKSDLVTYSDRKWSRNELNDEMRTAARSFQIDEKRLKALEQGLAAKKQSLKINEDKLSELKLTRETMKAELEQLKTNLELERQTAAAELKTIDEGKYLQTRQKLDSVRDRIEVMKQKRILQGEVNTPVRAHEERKKQEDETDTYIKGRFGRDKQ